jgi:Domain of unknown function (DUF4145)
MRLWEHDVRLINGLTLETEKGLRMIELYEGDISTINFSVDLLVISAFRGSYGPTRGTVIASLAKNLAINVKNLRFESALDLAESLGIWFSKELRSGPFRRVLCVEMTGYGISVEELIENVFVGVAVMEAKGIVVRSMVLPVLGAGSQHIQAALILATLLPAAKEAIQRSSNLERISFVEINPERAAELDKAMNEILGRSNIRLPKGSLIQNLKADILAALAKNEHLVSQGHRNLIEEMRRILNFENARSFEIGILGRRLVEFVVDELLNKKKTSPTLDSKIDELANLGVAGWIRSYMHVLRMLGNESAHEKDNSGKKPSFASEDDLVISLFCVLRVWNFWATWKSEA